MSTNNDNRTAPERELINVRIFHPAYKNVRARCEYTYCTNPSECGLYAQGLCAHDMTMGLSCTCCPYGSYKSEEGFTSRAKNFYRWMDGKKAKYGKLVDAVSFGVGKMGIVGGYVYLPYPYMDNYVNKIEGIVNEYFIKLKDFDADKIAEIYNFRPRTLFGRDEIKDFQKIHVPKFLQHLCETMPERYKEFLEKYPESAAEIQKKAGNYIGRKAYIKTLKTGSEIADRNGTFIFDGENLVCKDWKSAFLPFGAKTGTVTVTVTGNMFTEITDNSQVTDHTEFMD